jgi:hypothetical protein
VSHRALSSDRYLVHLMAEEEQRYEPSVSSVAGEMQISMDVRDYRFIQADSVSAASQVMRAQARVNVEKQRARGRSTCRFSKLPTAGGQPTAPRHCLYSAKRRLRNYPSPTTRLRCRLLFLGRRPLAVRIEPKTLDHTLVHCQSLPRSRALSPAAIVLLQLQHSGREHSGLAP